MIKTGEGPQQLFNKSRDLDDVERRGCRITGYRRIIALGLTVMEDQMHLRSSNRHVLLVICSIFLFGNLCSPREISMMSKQNLQSQEKLTRTTIDRFNEVFNRHDADGLAAFMTEDTVFEDTSPAPDGRRIEGKAAVANSGAVGSSAIPTHSSRPRK